MLLGAGTIAVLLRGGAVLEVSIEREGLGRRRVHIGAHRVPTTRQVRVRMIKITTIIVVVIARVMRRRASRVRQNRLLLIKRHG